MRCKWMCSKAVNILLMAMIMVDQDDKGDDGAADADNGTAGDLPPPALALNCVGGWDANNIAKTLR